MIKQQTARDYLRKQFAPLCIHAYKYMLKHQEVCYVLYVDGFEWMDTQLRKGAHVIQVYHPNPETQTKLRAELPEIDVKDICV